MLLSPVTGCGFPRSCVLAREHGTFREGVSRLERKEFAGLVRLSGPKKMLAPGKACERSGLAQLPGIHMSRSFRSGL